MNSMVKAIFVASILLATCPAQAALDTIYGERAKTSDKNYTNLANHLDTRRKQLESQEAVLRKKQQDCEAMRIDTGEKIVFLRKAEIQSHDEATRKRMENFRLIEEAKQNALKPLSENIEKQKRALKNELEGQEVLVGRFYLAGVARA